MPSGLMHEWPGSVSNIPSGMLLCDGSALSRTTYTSLYNAISFTFSGYLVGSGSYEVTGVALDPSDVAVGAAVEGTNIPAGTKVSMYDHATNTLYLTNFPTGSGSVTLRLFPWGNGDGSTTFNIPDMRDHVAIGANTYQLGMKFGEASHELTVAETPPHTHNLPSACATLGAGTTGYSATGTTNTISAFSTVSQNTGGGAAHNNMQPSTAVHFVIET